MAYVSFFEHLHKKTNRDYIGRVTAKKPEQIRISRQYGFDYWDGDRSYGYGGYSYDGRWKEIAEKMIAHYQLPPDASVLDVGCGKAFLLYEFSQLLPEGRVAGLDVSEYAIENGKPEVKDFLQVGDAKKLPFEDNSFDLVISNGALHNLKVNDLFDAVKEIERVKSKHAWICLESYRNEEEQCNLQYWSLTCQSFYSTDEWEWVYDQCGYTGDHEFFFFE